MVSSTTSSYYDHVGRHYDDDAPEFVNRYWTSPTAQRIRHEFRSEVKKYPFKTALEIGYGNGLDMVHMANTLDDVELYGLDVSAEMCADAQKRAQRWKLDTVKPEHGHAGQISEIFPGKQFDMIYVFFGGLNTVEDMDGVVAELEKSLAPDGKMVLTFVNKWYLMEMLLLLAKGNFKKAFARLQSTWPGYSLRKRLESKCYSPSDIKHFFSNFKILRRKGFSILHPAWYMTGLLKKLGPLGKVLWKVDLALQRTPAWKWGEYILFTLEKKTT